MKRLTEKCYCGYDIVKRQSDTNYTDKEIFNVLQKLGQFEDIMGKYNIESLDELENIIKNNSKLTTIEELKEQIKTKEAINNLYKITLDLKDNDFSDLIRENNELKTRITELEDKDWYEKTIAQLENQVERLLKENDGLKKEIIDKVYRYLTNEHNWKELKNSWLNNGECEYLKKILNTVLKGE